MWKLFDELTKFRARVSVSVPKSVKSSGDVLDTYEGVEELFANEYILPGSVSNLNNNALQSNILEFEANYTYDEYYNSEVTMVDVVNAVKGVKKCRPDVRFVPMKIYKVFVEQLIVPITILYTSIVQTGIVPKMLKAVDCFPLYKGKGKYTQASSYRAILLYHL